MGKTAAADDDDKDRPGGPARFHGSLPINTGLLSIEFRGVVHDGRCHEDVVLMKAYICLTIIDICEAVSSSLRQFV